MLSATPPSHPDIPPFPAPPTFSLLPEIYILLARLSLLHQPNGHTANTQIPPTILTTPLLETKDLPAQIYPLKQKLAKARAAVAVLPDLERTVEEQEGEIARLEGMVRGLKGRLGVLGGIARSKEDVVMGGVEEEGQG